MSVRTAARPGDERPSPAVPPYLLPRWRVGIQLVALPGSQGFGTINRGAVDVQIQAARVGREADIDRLGEQRLREQAGEPFRAGRGQIGLQVVAVGVGGEKVFGRGRLERLVVIALREPGIGVATVVITYDLPGESGRGISVLIAIILGVGRLAGERDLLPDAEGFARGRGCCLQL